MLKQILVIWGVTLAMMFVVFNEAQAINTVDPVGDGVISLEPQLFLTNLKDGNPGFASELELVFGLNDRMNLAVIVGQNADEGLADSDFSLGLEYVYTPVLFNHFALDLVIALEMEDIGLATQQFIANPFIEMNFDYAPDQAAWGVFIRAGMPIGSVREGLGKPIKTDIGVDLALGAYFTVVENHRLLFEFGAEFEDLIHDIVVPDSLPIRLGYNIDVLDNVELQAEFLLDVPFDFEEKSMVGGFALKAIIEFGQ